jgi:hypothetical protein
VERPDSKLKGSPGLRKRKMLRLRSRPMDRGLIRLEAILNSTSLTSVKPGMITSTKVKRMARIKQLLK